MLAESEVVSAGAASGSAGSAGSGQGGAHEVFAKLPTRVTALCRTRMHQRHGTPANVGFCPPSTPRSESTCQMDELALSSRSSRSAT